MFLCLITRFLRWITRLLPWIARIMCQITHFCVGLIKIKNVLLYPMETYFLQHEYMLSTTNTCYPMWVNVIQHENLLSNKCSIQYDNVLYTMQERVIQHDKVLSDAINVLYIAANVIFYKKNRRRKIEATENFNYDFKMSIFLFCIFGTFMPLFLPFCPIFFPFVCFFLLVWAKGDKKGRENPV